MKELDKQSSHDIAVGLSDAWYVLNSSGGRLEREIKKARDYDDAATTELLRRDAELIQLRARVSVLESAARIDIDAANSECASRDCMAWISRGMTCGTCPCVTVSSISDALGAALCSVQKVTGYAEAQP